MRRSILGFVGWSLVAPALAGLPCLAGDESINNTVTFSVTSKSKSPWMVEFASGQKNGLDSVKFASSDGASAVQELKSAGDSFRLEPGRNWRVTFTPNLMKDSQDRGAKLGDGSSYRFILRDGQGQTYTYKAEKPKNTLTSFKSSRKLVVSLDADGPHQVDAPMGQAQEQGKQDNAAGFAAGGGLVIDSSYY